MSNPWVGTKELSHFLILPIPEKPLTSDTKAHLSIGKYFSRVQRFSQLFSRPPKPPARTGFHAPLERLHFSNLPLDVDRTSVRLECGFLDRLGECRVSVA